MTEVATSLDSALKGAFGGTQPAKAEIVPPVVEKVEPVIEKVVEPVKVEKVEPVIEKTVDTPVKIKSFEEELSERTEGKYKSFDDIKKDLEAPKGETFFDDEIKHFNELKKKGVKIDKEFLELQSKDFDTMKPMEIHIEALKLKDENKGLSDRTLAIKLNKLYNISEWMEKNEEDMTDDDKANEEMFAHDANLNKEALKKFKNERTLFKEPDPVATEAMAKEAKSRQEKWEKDVDNDLVAKTEKFSTEVEDKETKEKIVFDFKISDEDKKEAAIVMKSLPKGLDAYIGRHVTKDASGNYQVNHAGVYGDYLKAKNFDKAMALAVEYGKEQGKLLAEKHAKNTSFGATESGTIKTVETGLAGAVRKAAIV